MKLYRSRVDASARKAYEDGVAQRDRRLLLSVVDQSLASSFGDEALLALGELSFEEGDFTAARWFWERIVPAKLPPGASPTWPGYPDTNLDLAAVRAWLVLVSIVEGSLDRAKGELAEFTRLHGDARGRLGGREVKYVEALAAMLGEAARWPTPAASLDWPTFAGNFARNKIAPSLPDPAGVAWRETLHGNKPSGFDFFTSIEPARDRPRSGNCFPATAGDLVLINDAQRIVALRAADGKPAWGEGDGTIYRDESPGNAVDASTETLGRPRYTVTIHENRVYARMGPAVTSWPLDRPRTSGNGYLVCLDLAAQGRLQWKIEPEEGWAFEGSPVAASGNVYVAMRRNDVRPQAHVACFDGQTGRLHWRRYVCAAETPARGMLSQATHTLLTLDHDTLYVNTNLGAVAAVRASDGHVLWLSLYPRATRGDLAQLAPHWQRDPSPCLFDRGTLYVAPADSPRIFAYDAAGGQLLWQTAAELEDATHLLGVAGPWLVAGGGKLYWISTGGEDRGRPRHFWPDGRERPGLGRGVLAGDAVLWPTEHEIHVFDARTAQHRRTIDLRPRHTTGGNLLVAHGRLFIATATELVALANTPAPQPEKPGDLTMSPSR